MRTPKQPTKEPQHRGKSSTLDILGAPNGKKVNGKWAEQQRKLNELRAQFLQDRRVQTETAQEELSNFSEHMADAATDSYDRDCALALLSSAQEALYEIDEALHRIANGTYGVCELSGKQIEIERLNAIPWTRFSKAAQIQLESRGGGNRVQLGVLGSCGASAGPEESTDEDAEETAMSRREREVA